MIGAAGAGFILGAIRSRIVLGAAAVAGIGFLGRSVAESCKRLSNDESLSLALKSVWNNGDSSAMDSAMRTAEKSIGPEAFNYGSGIICGGAGTWAARRGPSMLFSANKWAQERFGLGGGLKWTPMPDGTKVAAFGRSHGLRLTDGTEIWEHPNGTRQTRYANGLMTDDHANGARYTWNADGSHEICYANGKVVNIKVGGHRETLLPNGTIIQDFSDGTKCLNKADGTFVRTDLNGSKYTSYPNGDSVDIGPHIRPKGARILYSESEGALTTKMPDGRTHAWISLAL